MARGFSTLPEGFLALDHGPFRGEADVGNHVGTDLQEALQIPAKTMAPHPFRQEGLDLPNSINRASRLPNPCEIAEEPGDFGIGHLCLL